MDQPDRRGASTDDSGDAPPVRWGRRQGRRPPRRSPGRRRHDSDLHVVVSRKEIIFTVVLVDALYLAGQALLAGNSLSCL